MRKILCAVFGFLVVGVAGAYALDADMTAAMTTAASTASSDVWAAAKLGLPIFIAMLTVGIGIRAFAKVGKKG
jgi:hypothetical protein